jgi:hypothetical protein
MEVELGTTADRLAARVIGKDSQVPSVELVLEKPIAIACDTTDCFFVNTTSWRNPTTSNPIPAEAVPVSERQHSGFGARDRAAYPEHGKEGRVGADGAAGPPRYLTV